MGVAPLVLAAFFGMLFTRLTSPEFTNYIRRWGYLKELKKWKSLLSMLHAVVADAEEKQLTDRAVRIWLDDLKDLAFDADDILDEFVTWISQRKFMADSVSSHRVMKCMSSSFSQLSSSARKFHFKMGSQIRKITSRLDSISQRADILGLRKNDDGQFVVPRTPSTSFPDEARICGREEDKKNIIELVEKDDTGGSGNVCVIPIVGLEGVGKTTLAQLVYKDDALCSFEPKVWVSLSDEFEALRIAKAILESITFEPCKLRELNLVIVKLREVLAQKKFLLVLDNLDSLNDDLWKDLRGPLSVGAPGSTVIVTSSSLEVAFKIETTGYYELNLLSDDHCWEVFVKHAFKDDTQVKEMASMRNKVVERCRGLPLAACSFGALLRSNPINEWKNILSKRIWNLPDSCCIFRVLRRVYHQLPPELKRCFAYSAILPKQYEFEERDLVLLWMAEGLVPDNEGKKRMEEIGHEYFRKFVSLSIFRASTTKSSLYSMHDLVNEVARWAAGESYRTLDYELNTEQEEILRRVRYISYVRNNCDGIRKFEVFHKLKGLRTFIPFRDGGTSYITDNLFPLLSVVRKLRVLSLSGYRITKLPNSIGKLKHLRYLNLSSTMIESLPESMCFLYNLETLILRDCSNFTRLPSKIENLINLQTLDITGVSLMKEMPPGIESLKHLRILSDFFVGSRIGCGIEALKNLNFLGGTMRISQLENVVDTQCAYQAHLREKNHLDALELRWHSDFYSHRDTTHEKDVLDMLQPQKMLKELFIGYYGGKEFPNWIGDPAFSNIVLVRLENCENCTTLPPLGLLKSLKDLVIKGMNRIEKIGFDIYGQNCETSFPSLETLHFESMEGWKQWHVNDKKLLNMFPKLCKLSICECAKLEGNLPEYLPSLKELLINECKSLLVQFSMFSLLQTLKVSGCREVVCTSTDKFSDLKSMVLPGIPNFSCLKDDFVMKFISLENLEIVGCQELTDMCQNNYGLVQHFSSISCLKIKKCPKLVCLGSKKQIALPLCLEILELQECEKLKQPIAFHKLKFLKELHIQKCEKLIYLHRKRLPSKLAKLYVSNCENLSCLLKEGEDLCISSKCHLEYLSIRNCPAMKCLSSQGEFPASLKCLQILDCPKLISVAKAFSHDTRLEHIEINSCDNLNLLPEGLNKVSHLHEITLNDCPNFLHFPQGGLPSNLKKLYIGLCQQLKSLPDKMHTLLSLQELEIHGCPRIESYPKDGLPTNLMKLHISNPVLCCSLFEWGLYRFASLKQLTVHGGGTKLTSFLDEKTGTTLPISLNSLSLVGFPDLVELSSLGFQDLTLLEEIKIHDCPKLKFLPKNGFPLSVLELHIYGCPIIEELKKKAGKEWSKIAHIPYVCIDQL